MARNHVALFESESGRELIHSKCKDANLDINVLKDLIDIEYQQIGKLKKRGITESLNEIFDTIEVENEN